MDKKTLRKGLAVRREKAAASVDQAAACAELADVLSETTGAVSFFWPIRSEIDARPVMTALAAHRIVCLPLTQGRAALTFRQWMPEAEMGTDGFGVPVPLDTQPVVPDTLVVPMLGVDRVGHRLGYGAGHYDRTLEALRAERPVLAIGFAFEAQRLDMLLPIEPTDQPLNLLVTEAGRCSFEG